MPIKKSFLEKNLYFRVVKVFFLIVPLLVAVFIFLKGYIRVQDIFNKNIIDILQKNTVYVVYAVLGIIAYYLILKLIWRIFLYIFFGGLEDDTQKVADAPAQSAGSVVGQGAIPPEEKKEVGFLIFILIMIVLIYYIYNYQSSGLNLNHIKTGPACIPTGCGSEWRCSGSYYMGGQEIKINGCSLVNFGKLYSSWAGTCRQCP